MLAARLPSGKELVLELEVEVRAGVSGTQLKPAGQTTGATGAGASRIYSQYPSTKNQRSNHTKGLLLALAEGFNLWLRFFFPVGKKGLFMPFSPSKFGPFQ